MTSSNNRENLSGLEGAIIGMSCRFPGAADTNAFWSNLKGGVESVSFFSNQELEDSGVEPEVYNNEQYVNAGAIIEGADLFDAGFFGYSPREAEIIDPQHRLFLECAWEALENAGYDPERYQGLIGVYGGASMNTYLYNLIAEGYHRQILDPLQAVLGNDKDFLCARVSYKLNLEGPSITVQSACSTSLVAVHLAYQALLSGECDIAMAGGVSIRVPQKSGYLSLKGSILSPDGHCRAFDARAQGTIRGNGVGIVVLKRLADALDNGDTIHAVIKGSAINNDGAEKVGFTAPRVAGQAKVIRAAQLMADVEPETITYIEAHGTGTEIGDPIEVEALTEVFGDSAKKRNSCALGSVKTNIGHLDATAGIAGLIKTVLALKHAELPPSLNFNTPNPKINFASSPFYVNTEPRKWEGAKGSCGQVRRAGVSSFGMGGTNAHVILEEAPTVAAERSRRSCQLLVVSARTEGALERATRRLAQRLEEVSEEELGDVAYTLGVGRREFNWRQAVGCRGRAEAIAALSSLAPERLQNSSGDPRPHPVVFMFSGQGTQYAGMGRGLYQSEPFFRTEVDRCCDLLSAHLDLDLRQLLYPNDQQEGEAAEQLTQTRLTQPALFVTEYALARLLLRWGISPAAMIGHSIGEYVAACLAGVFSLEDGLALVAIRGRLMQQMPGGTMLSVRLNEEELAPLLDGQLCLASVNGPSYCVVSGPAEAVAECESLMLNRGVVCRRLHTSHAFHSKMMNPILGPFREAFRGIKLQPPQLPFISNVTGTWITDGEATDPGYWVQHLRRSVRFGDGVRELLHDPDRLLLEVGPGDTLSSLARLQSGGSVEMFSTMRPAQGQEDDSQYLLSTLGQLWTAGTKVDWSGFYADERRRRVPLPTYPFERRSYWLGPGKEEPANASSIKLTGAAGDVTDWFYVPRWISAPLGASVGEEVKGGSSWLIFADPSGLGDELARRLEGRGDDCRLVRPGDNFETSDNRNYIINASLAEHYLALVDDLLIRGGVPSNIIQLWNVAAEAGAPLTAGAAEQAQTRGFFSLLFLAQALGKRGISQPLRLSIITNYLHKVKEEHVLWPERATIMGPCLCIPVEYQNVTCRNIDFDAFGSVAVGNEQLISQILNELTHRTVEKVIALRDGARWVQSFEAFKPAEEAGETLLREGGTYLITGGLGGIGLVLAEHLAWKVHARLVLVGRTAFPPREDWAQLLEHGKRDEEGIRETIRRLLTIEEAGAQVYVASADVSDAEQLRAVLKEAVGRWGRIDGVIHAAGVAGDGVIQLKSVEKANAVLAPKLRGTVALATLLSEQKPDFFLLCSSITSVQPTIGQVDYCGANAFLDAYAHYASQNGTFTVALNWDRWNDVGMAFNARGKQTGGEINGDDFYHPLVGRRLELEDDLEVYATLFSAANHWALSEHRIMGRATLPGTVYLEMARAIFERGLKDTGKAIEISEVTFPVPLVLAEAEEREVRIVIEKKNGHKDFRFESLRRDTASGHSAGGEWNVHARLKVAAVAKAETPSFDLNQILERCDQGALDLDVGGTEKHLQDEEYIYFGPRWHSLRGVHLGQDEALARLELIEDLRPDLAQYRLHPALVDLATSATTFDYMNQPGGGIYLPLCYKKLTINAPLPGKVLSYIRHKNHKSGQGETIARDIHILDEDGRELVAIEDFILKRVPDSLIEVGAGVVKTAAGNGERNADLVQPRNSEQAASSPVESSLRYGLSSAQGVAVFDHILGLSRPQVLVSTLPLLERIEWGDKVKGGRSRETGERSARPVSRHPRPTLGSPYVAPRNDTERSLAGIWQDMLGIDQIGIHDNFFELGGNSLMGIELIAEVNKAFDANVPVVGLYEGSTIGSLGKLLAPETDSSAPLDARRARGARRREKSQQRFEKLTP